MLLRIPKKSLLMLLSSCFAQWSKIFLMHFHFQYFTLEFNEINLHPHIYLIGEKIESRERILDNRNLDFLALLGFVMVKQSLCPELNANIQTNICIYFRPSYFFCDSCHFSSLITLCSHYFFSQKK